MGSYRLDPGGNLLEGRVEGAAWCRGRPGRGTVAARLAVVWAGSPDCAGQKSRSRGGGQGMGRFRSAEISAAVSARL